MVKIAIQGHLTRGKEVIRILESLGGINDGLHEGNNPNCYYELHDNIIWCVSTKGINFKYYTLEEFETEFPFKIGDKITNGCKEYFIIDMDLSACELNYKVKTSLGSVFWVRTCDLTAHHYKQIKEMKKERNITLTLDKAKEWYNKGGELKEIALQAFTEKELNPLPRSWKEFCEKYPIKTSEAIICTESTIVTCDCSEIRDSDCDREVCPSIKSAEAHLAMIQLEQLRNCWRNGWIPKAHKCVYAIKFSNRGLSVYEFSSREFLSFPTREMAEEFLECFKDLIEKAGDLI